MSVLSAELWTRGKHTYIAENVNQRDLKDADFTVKNFIYNKICLISYR